MAVAVLTSCQSDSYYIKGEASMMPDGTVLYITHRLDTHEPYDSMIVSNGYFHYRDTTNTVRLCMIYAPSQPQAQVSFFTEPGNIYIELTPHTARSRVSGTTLNNQWQALHDTVAHYDRQLRYIVVTKSQATTPGDSLSPTRLHAQVKRLYQALEQRISETALTNRDNALGRFIISAHSK